MSAQTQIVSCGRFKVFVERHGDAPQRDTVILVNGALATTTSFRQMTRVLSAHCNVVLYDLPYSGQSRPHNPDLATLTKDDEVAILAALVERYRVAHVISVSWGGVATLLALSERPASVRSAIVGSFSPRMNGPMRDYVRRASECLHHRRYAEAADLLNRTVGKHLPRLLKLVNHRHLVGLDEAEIRQVHFHVEQLLKLDVETYMARLALIGVPVLFVNGEADDYTSATDVRSVQRYIRHAQFAVIPGAGHFLELESRSASERVRAVVHRFLGFEHGLPTPAAEPLFNTVPSFG